jgi:hypothetical protein
MEYANLAVIGGDLLDILFFWPTARPENSPDLELEPGRAWAFKLDARQAAVELALLAGDRAEGLDYQAGNLQGLAACTERIRYDKVTGNRDSVLIHGRLALLHF